MELVKACIFISTSASSLNAKNYIFQLVLLGQQLHNLRKIILESGFLSLCFKTASVKAPATAELLP